MANVAFKSMSAAEFVRWEAEQDERYEFIDGEVTGRNGGTYAHNLSAALLSHLRGTPCRVMGPEVMLRIEPDAPGFHPDLIVVCRGVDPRSMEMREARLIVEVLSPSTERKDRGSKWSEYQKLVMLEEYILIDPDKLRVEIYRRIGPNDWRLHICSIQEGVRLESIDFETRFQVIFTDLERPSELD